MQSYKCAADLLIVMDATSSTQSYINQFKQHALSMYDEIILTLKEKARIIDEMRVKVIVFRDLYVDQEKAIEESPVFTLPQDAGKYKAFLDGIESAGGGSLAESGLEGLAYGLSKMQWNKMGNKRRQICLFYSDDEAHPFEKAEKGTDKYYPKGMPHSLDEFSDWIESKQSKLIRNGFSLKDFRCFLFVPRVYPYTEMEDWTGVAVIEQKRGLGLKNLQFKVVTDAIGASF